MSNLPMYLYLLVYLGIPVLTSLIGYIIKGVLTRLDVLEDKMQHTITEPQVRQIMSDKNDPLKQDIIEIKEMQQKLLEMFISLLKQSR